MRIWHTISMIAATACLLGPRNVVHAQTQQQQTELQAFAEKLNTFYALLNSVHDRKSADAAAPQVARLMNAIPGAIKVDQTLVTTESGAIYGRMRFKFPFRNHLYPLEMWLNLTHIPSAQKALKNAGR